MLLPSFIQNRFVRHLLFWVIVILFFSSFELFNPQVLQSNETYKKLYWINFYCDYLPTYLFFTYSLLYIIIPLLIGKRYLTSLAAFLVLVALSIVIQKLFSEIDIYLIQPIVFDFSADYTFTFSDVWSDFSNADDWVVLSFDFILVGFIAGSIRFFNAWGAKQAENAQLEQDKLQTELKLLKTQINSAFLFNTLDDLYQHTIRKSPDSPQIVLQLASLMRYLLYENQADEVPLKLEIDMVKSYVFLAKSYHASRQVIDVSLQTSGSFNGVSIAPFLLLPFLENAFSQLGDTEQAWVSIHVSVNENRLTFRLLKGISSFDPSTFDHLEKRLDAIYRNRYTLKVLPEEEILLIQLDLALNETVPHQLSNPDGHIQVLNQR